MKKLLASDLDGTLIHDGKVNDSNIKSILKFRNQNNIFGVSTGRPYNGISFLKNDYGIDVDFYVLLNGALILDGNLNILKHEKIPYEILLKIFKKYCDCKLFGTDEGFETSILAGESYYTWDNTYFRNIDDLRERNCSLISIDFSNKEVYEIEKICEEINDVFSDYVVAYRNSCFVDVVPKGCSKGNGVKLIANMMNLDLENVYTIGDSFNDLSMFEVTKNSFSFPSIEEGLKKYVNYFVDSVSECIDRYILGE